jgi:hypothetical protein
MCTAACRVDQILRCATIILDMFCGEMYSKSQLSHHEAHAGLCSDLCTMRAAVVVLALALVERSAAYEMEFGQWRECTHPCGGGTARREAWCVDHR